MHSSLNASELLTLLLYTFDSNMLSSNHSLFIVCSTTIKGGSTASDKELDGGVEMKLSY